MELPFATVWSHIAARLFRVPRFIFGRASRRRHHRHVSLHVRRDAASGEWWAGDPRWYGEGTPPRRHNTVTALIDGEAAFTAVLTAIGQARHYVYIVGWALTPAFAMARPPLEDSSPGTLASALRDASKRLPVKVLVWRGSPLLFQPSAQLTERGCAELKKAAPAIEIALDGTSRPTHCHHQKAIVVDGQVAFVGGLDLTTLDADRWDVPGHPLRFGLNWHDVMVQLRGEAVRDVEQNFVDRWGAVTGEGRLPRRAPEVDPSWNVPVQIVRTIPKRTYAFSRRGEFGIAHSYLAAIGRAKRFIYLENQYLWSRAIVDALAHAMTANASSLFRIVLILPARADLGKFDNDEHVDELREVDNGRGMFHAYSLYSGGPAASLHGFRYRQVYVHSKVAVVDDEWYSIGSGNLNRRGLATDSEMNVQVVDPDGARDLRVRLWAEHLNVPVRELTGRDPIATIDSLWITRAKLVQETMQRHGGFLPALVHPYETGRMPGTWILQEAQSMLEGL